MKKLLKSEIYGSCEQCTGPTDVPKSQILQLLFMNSSRNSEICLLKGVPKKKKSKMLETQMWVEIISTQTHTTGYFGNFLGFRCILVIFRFQGLFQSSYRFRGYFGHFQVPGVFLSFFRFMAYFVHFQVLGYILVIFQVSGIFWTFQRFQGVFC